MYCSVDSGGKLRNHLDSRGLLVDKEGNFMFKSVTAILSVFCVTFSFSSSETCCKKTLHLQIQPQGQHCAPPAAHLPWAWTSVWLQHLSAGKYLTSAAVYTADQWKDQNQEVMTSPGHSCTVTCKSQKWFHIHMQDTLHQCLFVCSVNTRPRQQCIFMIDKHEACCDDLGQIWHLTTRAEILYARWCCGWWSICQRHNSLKKNGYHDHRTLPETGDSHFTMFGLRLEALLLLLVFNFHSRCSSSEQQRAYCVAIITQ